MDGVLVDSHPVHRVAWSKFLATVGKSVSDEGLSFILAGRRREEILRHFLGDLPEAMIAEYGRQKDSFFEENFHDVKLIPGVRKFLESLETAGLKSAIATSASSARTLGTLRRLQLDRKFSAIVTGDDVDVGKPDPAVYKLAAQRMNLISGKSAGAGRRPLRCPGRQGGRDALYGSEHKRTSRDATSMRRGACEFRISSIRLLKRCYNLLGKRRVA